MKIQSSSLANALIPLCVLFVVGCKNNSFEPVTSVTMTNTQLSDSTSSNQTPQTCSVLNGQGSQQWLGTSYGACTVTSCNTSFHIAENSCVYNIQGCSLNNAASALQSWTGSSWGSCTATSCNSNYVISNNTCVSAANTNTSVPAAATPAPTPTPPATPQTTGSTSLSSTSSPAICSASDVNSLRACFTAVQSKSTRIIEITTLIKCDTPGQCSFSLSNLSGPITIRGASGNLSTNPVGISRSVDFNSDLLNFNSIQGGLMIRNLILQDSANVPKLQTNQAATNAACSSSCSSNQISLTNTQNIMIDNVQFIEAKNMGIALNNYVQGLWVRNSTFKHNWVHGIWSASNDTNSGIHIENNEFIDNRSNGIMFAGVAPSSSDPLGSNTISGNHFRHNHNAALYYVCGGPCGGGQIVIEQHSYKVIIENNYFEYGRLDEDPSLKGYLVAGIEIAPTSVSNVTIKNNYFRDLSSQAISIDDPGSLPPPTQISANSNVYDNVLTPEVLNPQYLSSNSKNCNLNSGPCDPWVRPIGWISSTPNPCKLVNGACTQTISWGSSQNNNYLTVFAQANLFSSSGSTGGTQQANWISASAVGMDLYVGVTLLGSVLVYGN